MAESNGDKLKRLADSAALQVISRSAMVLVLPMMAWIGSTLVELKVQIASQSTASTDISRRVERLEAWRDRGWSSTPAR